MTSLATTLLLTIFVTIFLSKSIKIAGESERFAVFVLGRFQDFKGPGLILIIPITQMAHRLKVGDVGVVSGSGFVTFSGVDIPMANLRSFRQGQSVRINGFDNSRPELIASAIPAKNICPSCGHKY